MVLIKCMVSIVHSMSGHRVVPWASTHFYSATKYAVTALTEGLRQELREANTHIRATVRLCRRPRAFARHIHSTLHRFIKQLT